MKKLSLKYVNELLKDGQNYCIRMNEITRQIHILRYNINCSYEIVGYITFYQFIKLDLTIDLVEIPTKSLIFDYYILRKEIK